MSSLFALDVTHVSHRVRVNEEASSNIQIMNFTAETSQLEISALKDEAFQNMPVMWSTADTSHFDMSALNNVASLNM